ncbi:MAG: hypothetical protein NTX25_04910 [Proteobacteria bacterium]|nr:hypothetical protein [Pseudomonadota bacterium]
MDEKFRQIERILKVYLTRAETALAALQTEDWPAFDEAMRWRNAAFHNFRAADHLIRLHTPDYFHDPVLAELGQKIRDLDRQLAREIEVHQELLSQKLIKISDHRAKISKFFSGVQDQVGFQKTV